MSVFGAMLAMTFIPVSLVAWQSDAKQHPDPPGPQEVDYHCDQNKMFYSYCKGMEQRDKDAASAKVGQGEVGKQKADANNWKKLLSSDKEEQVDGVGGEVKDLNSRGNTNTLSKEITDKSLSLVEQMAHQESKLLDEVGNSVEKKSLDVPAAAHSSFGEDGHTMKESTKGEGQSLSLQQQFGKTS